MRNCASAAGAGWQDETVDSNWHWDGEDEGPTSATYPKGVVMREKLSQSDNLYGNAVFWYKCKCFGLRGSDKHRQLDVDQNSIDYDENGRYLSLTSHPRTTKVG